MKSVVTPAVMLTLALATLAWADEAQPAGDLAVLQGRWKAWLSDEEFMLFEVKGKSFTLGRYSGAQRTEPWAGTLIVNESTGPRQLTWVGTKSAGKEVPDNHCIYELHGDTLLIIGGGASHRPKQFYSGGTSKHQTLVLKREAAADTKAQ